MRRKTDKRKPAAYTAWTRPHWKSYIIPGLLLLLSLAWGLGDIITGNPIVSVCAGKGEELMFSKQIFVIEQVLWVCLLLVSVDMILRILFTKYYMTKTVIGMKTGWFSRSRTEVLIMQCKFADRDQSVLQRLLGAETITLNTTESTLVLSDVPIRSAFAENILDIAMKLSDGKDVNSNEKDRHNV